MGAVVAAALFRGREVLLCHRATTRRWSPNVWDLPGGHVEGDETPVAALVRELREELAVHLCIADLPTAPHSELLEDEFRLSIWRIDRWSGEPLNSAPEEHDCIAWFSVRDAVALPLAHRDYPALLTRLASQPT